MLSIIDFNDCKCQAVSDTLTKGSFAAFCFYLFTSSHPSSRAFSCLRERCRRKGGSAWIPSGLWCQRLITNFWTFQSFVFSLVKLFFSFQCEHQFIDKPMVTTEPAVARARLIGLGLELYPANMLGMLYKLTSLDSCRVFLEYAKIEKGKKGSAGRETLFVI